MSFRLRVERYAPLLVLALATAISVFSRVGAGAASLAFYDDDFFYYLRVAVNLAAGHGSTFDGIHLTNGYHPLWLLVLTALARVLPIGGVFTAVMWIVCLSTGATYFLAERMFLRRTSNAFLASLAAAAIGFSALFLTRGGMEVVLTIPLALLLCFFRTRPQFRWTAGNAVVYAVLAALLVLSRLDSVLLVLMLFFFEAIALLTESRKRRDVLWLILAAGLFCLPLLLYAGINLHVFGTAFPISSQAKQLRLHRFLNSAPISTLLVHFPIFARVLIVLPSLILLPLALWQVARRRVPQLYLPVVTALLLFPLVHILALSILSDWPLWQWYLYPLVLGEFAAALTLFGTESPVALPTQIRLQWAGAALLFLAMGAYAAGRVRSLHHPEGDVYSMYHAARRIEAFAKDHPGIYAMGDRAGTPGYLLQDPMIQMEGLVMDKPFLARMRREENLNQVLAEYHVAYFIATNPKHNGACYQVREPYQAGPDSHSMHGLFCQAPLQEFAYNGWVTDIFDLRAH